MFRWKKAGCWSAICAFVFSSNFVSANPTAIDTNTGLAIGTVVEILYGENEQWGNCMIKLRTAGANTILNPNDALADCGNTWLSLDCSGTYVSKTVATSFLTAAQISQVTGNRIGVYFDKTKRHGGAYCTAFRVDGVNAP